MSTKNKDDASTSGIKLAISSEELEKQLGTIRDKENDFSLALKDSNTWFKDVEFYDLENEELALIPEFFRISFDVVGTNYLQDAKQQHKIGKIIVVKKTSGLTLDTNPNDQAYNDTPKELRRDISIDNMLFLDADGMVEYPAKIKNYILSTRAKIKKDIWHKKMNVWKAVAWDALNPTLVTPKKKKGSNKKRELKKFLSDSLATIMTRIDTDIAEDDDKHIEDNNFKLNHAYLGKKDDHSKGYSFLGKTKEGKPDNKKIDTLYLQFQKLKRECDKHCNNNNHSMVEVPVEK